ncbi:uncharacterized protein FIBRA_05328 [Fibroporia radiculosa]|uniref:Uncharacterized protein n=1 Tax=Fibroporia radiculosa TaxID=599839 RepID=J4H3F9_9APHY|nr:uncharacterized protein FIBRA_05328 [Fibroporia radiculosa]CCM03204.1 predicted protein [Fibroporia radiculosa]
MAGLSTQVAKLGLLPKRPVSLLPQQQDPTKQRSDDEDEELDYVENPFEEGRN